MSTDSSHNDSLKQTLAYKLVQELVIDPISHLNCARFDDFFFY